MLSILYLVVEMEAKLENKKLLQEFENELRSLIQKFRTKYPSWSAFTYLASTLKAREPKIYWFRKPKGEKDVLIFDAGYQNGDIHIYEHKETLPAKELNNEIIKHGYCVEWRILID